MASAREKIPQLGLWDDEVPKVSHDKMVIWAYENAEILVRQYLTSFPKKDYGAALSTTWEPQSIRIPARGSRADLPPLPPKPTSLVRQKVLEQVIEQHPENANGRSLPRILGYADLVIIWAVPFVEWDAEQDQWQIGWSSQALLVEAKTVLPTLGELMRQLNLYRLVFRNVVVVAPDETYADILLEQGIYVATYTM
jgi:hypothetical protein